MKKILVCQVLDLKTKLSDSDASVSDAPKVSTEKSIPTILSLDEAVPDLIYLRDYAVKNAVGPRLIGKLLNPDNSPAVKQATFLVLAEFLLREVSLIHTKTAYGTPELEIVERTATQIIENYPAAQNMLQEIDFTALRHEDREIISPWKVDDERTITISTDHIDSPIESTLQLDEILEQALKKAAKCIVSSQRAKLISEWNAALLEKGETEGKTVGFESQILKMIPEWNVALQEGRRSQTEGKTVWFELAKKRFSLSIKDIFRSLEKPRSIFLQRVLIYQIAYYSWCYYESDNMRKLIEFADSNPELPAIVAEMCHISGSHFSLPFNGEFRTYLECFQCWGLPPDRQKDMAVKVAQDLQTVKETCCRDTQQSTSSRDIDNTIRRIQEKYAIQDHELTTQ
ncbi:hypothetical protein HOC37_03505 [bacterium]|nr:hypothetical protein [bacterium]